jgi:CubicO group peptidase (beta-lactamase class C family)
MITPRLCCLLVAVGLLSGCVAPGGSSAQRGLLPTATPESVGISSDRLRVVDGVMRKFVIDKKIAGGIVMIARGGKIAFFNTYGKMNLVTKRPMRQDAIFRIYSMSKAITTAAALCLVDDGKLRLDDPVSTYIPETGRMKVKVGDKLVDPKRPMTVRDLMRHTAGFSYGGNPLVAEAYKKVQPTKSKTLAELGSKLIELPLAYSPGEAWEYSIATDVLGLVIERVSGQALDQFLSERIFKPLRMVDTGFYVPQDKLDRFTANYRRGKDGVLTQIDAADQTSKYATKPTFFSGGGGLVSTAQDYMRFLMMVRNGGALGSARILSAKTAKLMTTNQLPPAAFPIRFGKQVRHGTGFSLGFSIRVANTEWDANARVGEYGWGGAASTHYWSSPADDLIVITLEQTMPYTFDTEWAVKKPIYAAIEKQSDRKSGKAARDSMRRRQRIRALTRSN